MNIMNFENWMLLTIPLLAGGSLIAMQLIREKLFTRILEDRSFPLDGLWYGPRNSTALRMTMIWGEKSREILKIGRLRNLIFAARVAAGTLYICVAVVLIALGWFAWHH
jgi:hypothetical protein